MTHHGYQALLATVALSAGLLAYGATTVSADDARTVTTVSYTHLTLPTN